MKQKMKTHRIETTVSQLQSTIRSRLHYAHS
jgi:hypothetical protein